MAKIRIEITTTDRGVQFVYFPDFDSAVNFAMRYMSKHKGAVVRLFEFGTNRLIATYR